MDFPSALPANEKARILLVEDDPAVRRSLQLLLQADGFDVRAYASSQALLSDQTALGAACLVADYRMSDASGVVTLAGLRAKGWMGPAILITAFPSQEVADQARGVGFEAVFEKPLRTRELVKTIERLVRPGDGG